MLKLTLSVLGAWPGEVFGETVPLIFRFHRKFLVIETIIIILAQLYYMKIHYKQISLVTFGQICVNTFMTMNALTREFYINLKGYGTIVKYYIADFHLYHLRNKGDYEMKVYLSLNKFSNYFVLVQTVIMVIGFNNYNLTPLYNNARGGTFSQPLQPAQPPQSRPDNIPLQFSIYFEAPGMDPKDHFYLITAFNWYLSYMSAVLLLILDSVMYVMVFQIIGHLKILIKNLNNLSNISKESDEITSARGGHKEDKDKKYLNKLTEIIEHHKQILDFQDKMSSFFGFLLAFSYFYHLINCCILLLECTQKDAGTVIQFVPMSLAVFGELIQTSVVFEVVGVMSEKLVDAVYCTPWEDMGVRERRVVQLLLQRVQTPMVITAMGVTPVGITTMMRILKATFSYYTLLQQMNTSGK